LNKYFIFTLIFLTGCSHFNRPEYEEIKNSTPFQIKKVNPVKTVFVKDFIIPSTNLDNLPDKKISISLNKPVKISDFFQMLVAQGVNIICKFENLQEENFNQNSNENNNFKKNKNDKSEIFISVPYFEGSLKSLLLSLQKTHGLFFYYSDNVLSVRETAPVYVKVLMPGMEENIVQLLKESFKISDTYFDSVSGRVVFTTDYFTYQKVSEYFKNNKYLTLLFFDVMILEKEDKTEFKKGFDWSNFSATLNNLKNVFSSNLSSSGGLFNLIVKDDNYNFDVIYNNLVELSKFSILQSARLSVLNGGSCKLDVTEKIPYISKISVSSLNDNTTSQNYDFSSVNSGLVIDMQPQINQDLIALKFSADIQNVVDFLEVGTTNNLVSQPVVSVRNIKNLVLFRPGDLTLIGGLKYNKVSKSDKFLTFRKGNGVMSDNKRTFILSILIRSEIVRYQFQ
jgi:hypothetical protein